MEGRGRLMEGYGRSVEGRWKSWKVMEGRLKVVEGRRKVGGRWMREDTLEVKSGVIRAAARLRGLRAEKELVWVGRRRVLEVGKVAARVPARERSVRGVLGGGDATSVAVATSVAAAVSGRSVDG